MLNKKDLDGLLIWTVWSYCFERDLEMGCAARQALPCHMIIQDGGHVDGCGLIALHAGVRVPDYVSTSLREQDDAMNRGGGGAPRAGVAGGAGAPPRGWGLHGASRRRNDSAFNDMYVLSAHGRGRPNARPGPLLGSVPAMWARSPFFKAFLRYLHNSTLKKFGPRMLRDIVRLAVAVDYANVWTCQGVCAAKNGRVIVCCQIW